MLSCKMSAHDFRERGFCTPSSSSASLKLLRILQHAEVKGCGKQLGGGMLGSEVFEFPSSLPETEHADAAASNCELSSSELGADARAP